MLEPGQENNSTECLQWKTNSGNVGYAAILLNGFQHKPSQKAVTLSGAMPEPTHSSFFLQHLPSCKSTSAAVAASAAQLGETFLCR